MHEKRIGPGAVLHEASLPIEATVPSAYSSRSATIPFGGPKLPRNFTYLPPVTLYIPFPRRRPAAFFPGTTSPVMSWRE